MLNQNTKQYRLTLSLIDMFLVIHNFIAAVRPAETSFLVKVSWIASSAEKFKKKIQEKTKKQQKKETRKNFKTKTKQTERA